jgi:integrase
VRWSWYDPRKNPPRQFKKERFRTETEAKAKKRQVEQEVADNGIPDYAGGRQSLRQWAERWFEMKSNKVKPKTAHGYRSILDTSVLPEFGDARVRTITTADIQEWVDGMKQTPPTIKHHHAVLRAVLAHALKGKAIRDNPARDVELPTDRSIGRTKLAPRFLTPDEISRLTAALKDQWPYDLMVLFTAYTGLRASEVAGLNVGDLDVLRNRVSVSRKVPMPGWLTDDMRAYLDAHPNANTADAPLFPGRKYDAQPGGRRGAMDWSKPYNHELFYRRMWRPALIRSGVGAVRFHDLRHTFASLMAHEGVPPYRVASYMGHKDATVTLMIYTHLWDDDAAQDADRLARPVAGPDKVIGIDSKRTS